MAQARDALGRPVFYEFSTMDSRLYPQYAAQVDGLGAAYLQLGDAVNWANAFIGLY